MERLSSGVLQLNGHGQLRDALAVKLSQHWRVVGPESQGGNASTLVVLAHDTPIHLEDAWSHASRLATPWLSVHCELDQIVVGPLVSAGAAGCAACARRRRRQARSTAVTADLWARHGAQIEQTVSPLLGPLASDLAAAVVIAESLALETGGPRRLELNLMLLRLATLEVTQHRFLPVPECTICGRLPDDCSANARYVRDGRLKTSPTSTRIRRLADLESELMTTYVDDETGVVGALSASGEFSFPVVAAPLRSKGVIQQSGYGRTLDFQSSRLTAITEALERLGGMYPRGQRTTVRDSYCALGDRALDPRRLGLYSDERYSAPGFPFQRYHENLSMPWVWGYSFARREPLLIPECCAYYRTSSPIHVPSEDQPFVYEISNGCALGSSLGEAVLHGLLEIAERDAFLMTWLARLPIPRLDPATARDARIPLVIERIEHRTGYTVQIYNATLEEDIPCFWVMATDTKKDPNRPRAVCAAGSALNAEAGVLNALQELNTTIEAHCASFPKERERAGELVRDADLVRQMADHALVYCHEDAFERLAFLPMDQGARSFDEFRRAWLWPQHATVADDLDELLGRFLRNGLDVIMVNQTTLEHRACGFHCVKAIVPGMIPMTFGHHTRRIDGLSRLYEVPYRLGHSARPLTAADINPHPHPFP